MNQTFFVRLPLVADYMRLNKILPSRKIELFSLVVFLLLGACSGVDRQDLTGAKKEKYQIDPICRKHDSCYYPMMTPNEKSREKYPWEEKTDSSLKKITKEFFLCRGNPLHPIRTNPYSKNMEMMRDCQGGAKHKLPTIHNREDVYPILLDLLNDIQKRLKKKVVITSGHRCKEHDLYANGSNAKSKHIIGAEVDFYVQGLEEQPLQVIALLCDFYKTRAGYVGKDEYEIFSSSKNMPNNKTTFWENKEIKITLFPSDEGRNFDNRHPYPYISIEVLYDRDKKINVSFP